ncbi:helix-turn-helix domain-containing protein [Sinorhizobium sp. BG8]|nr:helix-turn-helix domain-containing protein [Sinorhizobium sp. BG8]
MSVRKWCADRGKNLNRAMYWEINKKIPSTDCSHLTENIVEMFNDGRSIKRIAQSLGVSRATVKKYLSRSRAAKGK